MHIPASFKLSGHTYVVQRTGFEAQARGFKGSCFNDQLIVQVADDIAESCQQETFWHEVVEAIDFTYELKLDHQIISVLGAAIHQVVETREGSLDARVTGKKKG